MKEPKRILKEFEVLKRFQIPFRLLADYGRVELSTSRQYT